MPLQFELIGRFDVLPQCMIKRARGFTLVELLASVAIIAVLAVLSVVVTSKVRRSANDSKCASNLRGIGVGLQLYAADNKGELPPCAQLPSSGYKISYRPKTFWFDALNPYMGYPQYAANRSEAFPEPTAVGTGFPLSWQLCPSKNVETLQRQTVGYGWNISNFGHDLSRAASTGFGARMNQISQPARTIIIGDSVDEEILPEQTYNHRYIYDYDRESRVPYPERHGGGGNYLFVDGHIQRLAAASMSTPEVTRMFKRTD